MKLKSVEGASFAGKSTLARHLAKKHDGLFVGEYMDYVHTNGRNGFPPAPTTLEEAKAGVDFFLGIERERTEDIRRGLGRSLLVVSDRTVLSLAAYQIALDKQKDTLPGNQIAVPDYTLETVQAAIDEGDIEMPEQLVVLRAGSQAVHEGRVRRRGNTTMGAFNQWHFSQALTHATEQAADLLLPLSTQRQVLMSFDGDEAFAQNVQEASDLFELPLQ